MIGLGGKTQSLYTREKISATVSFRYLTACGKPAGLAPAVFNGLWIQSNRQGCGLLHQNSAFMSIYFDFKTYWIFGKNAELGSSVAWWESHRTWPSSIRVHQRHCFSDRRTCIPLIPLCLQSDLFIWVLHEMGKSYNAFSEKEVCLDYICPLRVIWLHLSVSKKSC